jgi:hypothetical protein
VISTSQFSYGALNAHTGKRCLTQKSSIAVNQPLLGIKVPTSNRIINKKTVCIIQDSNGQSEPQNAFMRCLAPISFAWTKWQTRKPCPLPLSSDPREPLAFRAVNKTDAKKLQMAQELSEWMDKTMRDSNASVAVVARGGSWQTKTQDKTLMEHSGLLMYDKKLKNWVIYDLLNNNCKYPQRVELFRNHPVDFFYAQPNYDWDALLMIPDRDTRRKLRHGLVNGDYKKLNFTQDYNLVTTYNTQKSLNCNKWVLMNLVAAKKGNYNPSEVIEKIDQEFKPAVIDINPFLRVIAMQHPTVLQKEVPCVDPIKTVTVESLYRSNLFEKKEFYSGKSIDQEAG